MKPTQQIIEQLAAVAAQYPLVVKWIGDWRQGELESLPGNRDNTAVAQGRCLVLTELYRLFQDAPGIAAKSNDSRPPNRIP